MNVEIVDGQLV